MGFSTLYSDSMRAFRGFQRGLPLADGYVYSLERTGRGWAVQVRL